MKRVTRVVVGMSALAFAWAAPRAQQRTAQYQVDAVGDRTGAAGLSLALRKLGTVGSLMHTTAHPDDENNAVLALHARRLGMRVTLLTATRGDGGQNEIGPELFDALGILRTEELLAAHRWDGAEQYFTRAADFGYSFSPQETLEKWGHQEILGDFVRMIRTIRPDVIVTLPPTGTGGGQHHQMSAVLTREAFAAAADPKQFPEQLAEGLRPWQAKKLFQSAGFGGGGRGPGGPPQPPPPSEGIIAVDTAAYEPLLGCTIGEIGSIASGMHICQGRAPMLGPAGAPFGARYRLVEGAAGNGAGPSVLFAGIDASLASIASYAGAQPPAALVEGLRALTQHADRARTLLETQGTDATLPALIAGLKDVRALRQRLASLGVSDEARYEIDFRLKPKETQYEDAIVLAHALRLDAVADDGLVVATQPVKVTVTLANRGEDDVKVSRVALQGFDGDASCAAQAQPVMPGTPFTCATDVKIPKGERLTGPYWDRPDDVGRATFEPNATFGLPFRPTPFRARVELDVAGTPIVRELPVQSRYASDFNGEKRMELKVVPAFAVRVTPGIAVIPIGGASRAVSSASSSHASRSREIRVHVVNGNKGAATGSVTLKAPADWRVTPASAPLSFTREDESITSRFNVSPPAGVSPGEVKLVAEVSGAQASGLAASDTFAIGYQVIEYPHTQRRHKLIPAEVRLKVIDAAVAPNLTVGYIMGVGDQVPSALEQLGAKVELIDTDTLAWGDLSKYDTIVTGVRAYERRDDLKANNHRLLAYAERGGTVIVQYNKFEFNQAQYGPYPVKVGSNRVTDERAPVKRLVPDHPIFTMPNRIVDADFDKWVQERGLYFLGERDPKYVDLVELEDPFDFNKGVKTGALVEARYGKGRWVYVGLGLWRQLPAGTDGAYRLIANVISLGKTGKSSPGGARDTAAAR